MYKKNTLILIASVLILEAILVAVLPTKIPRALRAMIAAGNVIAVAVLWLMSRQKKS
ncbi:MAG: hypothetical protein WCO38_06455 [Verrucomicrobiota bacterium]|jgi:hypothetical protein